MERSNDVQALISSIIEGNIGHKPYLQTACSQLSPDDWSELHNLLSYYKSLSVDIGYLADCYNTVVQDTYLEQIYFMRKKRYRYSTLAEVADAVYHNPEYMEKYMYGLSISLFFWPAHRLLKEHLSRTIPKKTQGRYLEVGPGHGFFFKSALVNTTYSSFLGIDISKKSIEVTESVLKSGFFGDFSGYELKCMDFCSAALDGQAFDALVMGEVLEHVEEPEALLKRIRQLTHKDSYIWISTCMNAPAVDHIYLFESEEHLASVIESAGLKISDKCLIPYPGLTLDQCKADKMCINIGTVLTHA